MKATENQQAREHATDLLIVGGGLGGVAGALAAYCLIKGLAPHQVRNTPAHLADFQRMLQQTLGFELAWPEPRVTSR